MTTPAPTLDLSGLSPDAVRQVQQLADQLRTVETPPPRRQSHLRDGETPEQWIARLREWAESHKPRNPNFDDSRDSIYD